jgi:hypothetical protein
MENINFCGLDHYPLGNVNLEFTDDANLKVSNFLTTSDGVVIRTNGACSWEMELNPVSIDEDDVFGVTYNQIDNLNRLKTVGQWSLIPSPSGEYVYLCVNSRLEGDIITVTGMKEGEVVFSREYNKNDNPANNWIHIAVFVVATALAILDRVDYKSETKIITHPDGSQTKEETTTKSIGNGGQAQVKAAAELRPADPVFEDEVYEVDHIYITSSRYYPNEYSEELSGRISEVLFTAKTQKAIEIKDEQYAMEC